MRFTRFVVKYPLFVISITLLITLFLGYQLKYLKIETDISQALPKDLPAKRLYDEMSENFPSRDIIFIAIRSDSIYSPGILSLVSELTDTLFKLKGIQDVLSPVNADVIVGQEEGIAVVPALSGEIDNPETIKTLRERLASSDFAGSLVSRDEKAFGILVFLKSKVRVREVARNILEIIQKFKEKTGVEIYATGRPVLQHALAVGLLRDVHVFFSLAILVITLFLFLSFRSLRGVLLPFSVVILSVIWTMGFMALVGIKFSHSTEFMPVLLISIGIADGIHILHTYYQRAGEIREKKRLVLSTMETLNLPVILTSLTTAIAFLALGVAGFRSLQELGGMTAFGVIMAMFLSLYFIPAVLSLLSVPRVGAEKGHLGFLHRGLTKLGGALVTHKTIFVIFIALFLIFILSSYPRIKVENSTIENFKPENEIRKAYELMNKHFSGAEVLYAVVKSEREGGIKDPLLLKEMDSFKQYMLKEPMVGDVVSVSDLVKRLNRVLNNDREEYYRIPDTLEFIDGFPVSGKELIAQYLALYTLSTEPGRFESIVTDDFKRAKISIFLKEGRRSVIHRIDKRAREFIEKDFRHADEVELTGVPEIYLVINDLVVKGQAKSIILSLFLVSIIVAIAFRSPVAGFYGIIPLLFAMLVNFGVMGWLGIYANLENMVTSNIAIGVGVDYMIHFIHRFKEKYKEMNGDVRAATEETMNTSGVAILINALAVALGFSTIMASSFRSVSQMGFLITLAMVSTCFAAITLLPVLLAIFKPEFLTAKK
jgi:hypothetical protein